MKDSQKLLKRTGAIGLVLCAACCMLPIVAAVFGVGLLATLADKLKWIGIGAMIVAILLFTVSYFRKRKAKACDI